MIYPSRWGHSQLDSESTSTDKPRKKKKPKKNPKKINKPVKT